MRNKVKSFIGKFLQGVITKTKSVKNLFFRKIYERDKARGIETLKKDNIEINLLILLTALVMVICLIRLAYFSNISFSKNMTLEFVLIYGGLGLILMMFFLLQKIKQLTEEDLEKQKNELIESNILSQQLTNEVDELKLEHRNQVESIKEVSKKQLTKLGDSFVQIAQNDLVDFKKATAEKVENEIRNNLFSSGSGSFNESAGISKAEQLQKEREDKAELKRREDKIEANEKITNFIQQSLTWKDKFNNEIFETNKRVGELGLRLSEELPKLKQSIYEIKTWAEGNFTQMKFWVKEEILALHESNIKIVSQFESFKIQYDGDKREIKHQFDGVNLYIEKVAMTAHERLLAFAQQTQNDFLRLDRRVDNSDRLLGDIQHNLEKGLLYAKMEREQMKSENKGFFRTIQHNLEKGLLQGKMEREQMKNENKGLFRNIQHNIEKGLLQNKMEREQIRNEADKKIFILDKKLDKTLDELAFKHQVSIRDLTHLMEIKEYQLKDLVGKNHTQIKLEITDMKANHKLQYNNLDIKYTVQLKDLETVHMRHLFEQDQKIMKVVNKIEGFHNDISAVGVRMDRLNVQVQGMGVANDQVRQEAKNIVTSLSLRMESIDNALHLTRETSKVVEGRIQNSVRGDLLKLKEITINQEGKAKELASAEGGLKLMFDDYHNQATEKELNLKSIEQNLDKLHGEIALERKNIQVDSRLQNGELVMSDKLANLEYEKDRVERAYDDVNKEANMYKDMAMYYKKEGRKGS